MVILACVEIDIVVDKEGKVSYE
ncbi:hypothetical protein [Iningainema tapete]